MSFFQTLEMSLFMDNARWVSIVVDCVKHTIPIDTILNIPRNVRLASMIVHYCLLKDENPEKACRVFNRRSGQLFSYIVHFADTGHLVYPADLDLTKSLVQDLCRYEIIRVKEGYCFQCLMDYIKQNGLDDFRSDQSGVRDPNSSNPLLRLSPESLVIQTESAGGEVFQIRAWGMGKTLEELLPKAKMVNDSTYFQLQMCATVINTDACQFLKQIADTICCVVKKLGFRVTSYAAWSDTSSVIHYGQWLLYRELPAIGPVTTFASISQLPPPLKPIPTPSRSVDLTHIRPPPKAKRRWCPCFKKNNSVDIPMQYPDIPGPVHPLNTRVPVPPPRTKAPSTRPSRTESLSSTGSPRTKPLSLRLSSKESSLSTVSPRTKPLSVRLPSKESSLSTGPPRTESAPSSKSPSRCPSKTKKEVGISPYDPEVIVYALN